MKRWLVPILVLIFSGCHPTPPDPPDPPQPEPDTFTARLTILDEDRRAIPDLTCVIDVDDAAPPVSCVYDGIRGAWTFPLSVLEWGGTLNLSAPGRSPITDERVIVTPEMGERILGPAFQPLPRLRARGQFIETEQGEWLTLIGSSDFALYERWLAGENIEPVLQQRKEAGFNILRIFTAYQVGGIGRLVPREHPDFYNLTPFARKLASFGLYAELVGLTGPYQNTLSTHTERLAHWAALSQAAQANSNILLELINEWNHEANQVDGIQEFPRPPVFVLATHGSGISQGDPLEPFWGYASRHFNDAFEWQRKVGHNAMEVWSGPTWANENTRCCDRFNDPRLAFDAAAGGALLAAGSLYHSVHGKLAQLWDAQELTNAQAWAAGAKSVPLSCQAGSYKHRQDLETAEFLRVYQRGNDPACIVKIRHE